MGRSSATGVSGTVSVPGSKYPPQDIPLPCPCGRRIFRDSDGAGTRVPATDADYSGTEIDRCSIHGRRGHHSCLSVLIEAVDGTRLHASKCSPDTQVLLFLRIANR